MSGPTIDVTARSRIRALAARMYRAQIAGVFSVAGGTPSVDESMLDADQRAEAARILEEVAAATLKVEEVETASSVAAVIPRYVKPSCSICDGRAVVRRGSSIDLCDCVDRRWQAAVDRETFVAGLRAPDRASGVRVESTRESDADARVAAAKEALARARAASAAACADIDTSIGVLELKGAAYFTERRRLEAEASQVDLRLKTVADAQAKVEEIALRIAHLIKPLFDGQSKWSADNLSLAHASIDTIHTAAVDASVFRGEHGIAEEAVRRIAEIDVEIAPIIARIERLRAERARIARHHQPKIDRAEKRLRRLVYLSGGTCDVDGASAASQESEGK